VTRLKPIEQEEKREGKEKMGKKSSST